MSSLTSAPPDADPPAGHRRGTVLVVDDERGAAAVASRFLTRDGYDVAIAVDGASALRHIRDGCPDLVLLDVKMADVDGLEVCRRIRQDPATCLLPVVLMTGLSGHDTQIRGIDVGADDCLTKPIDVAHLRARVRALMGRKRYTDQLDSADQMTCSLALTIEARDPYTQGHCERLARYASRLGIRLGLPEADIGVLHRSGYLHDLGKIAVPDVILLKPGPLLPGERTLMQRHTIVGDALCSQLNSFRQVRPIVRHHHERLDGSGYPDGLAGAAIPLLAQVLGIVDVYDALTTDRPYRRAIARSDACGVLQAEVSHGWRRSYLVDRFIRMVTTEEQPPTPRPTQGPDPQARE